MRVLGKSRVAWQLSNMHRWSVPPIALVCLSLLAASPAPALPWVATWATAQQELEPGNALPAGSLNDATLRQLVRASIGGARIRVRISNAFGRAPLTIDDVHVARAVAAGSPRTDARTDHAVTFSGAREVTIPAGAEYVSDPVAMPVQPLETLAVSIHVPSQPPVQTGHPGSRATSYVARGDRSAVADLPGATTVEHWYFLSEVDVEPARPATAVAVLGDSITDGHGVVTNGNGRWTDFLADRLRSARRNVAVLNVGIGGNRVLQDGLGPNAAARFARDVLRRPGVKYLIVLEGVNDLGTLTRDHPVSAEEHRALVTHIVAAYAQMIGQAHEHGIKAIGATILPYGGSGYYHPDAANEADRQAINAWIRARGHFDAVVDFDKLMRDPKLPERLRSDYDSDGLHPSDKGYRAMGDAVPLALFGE
jgi:lysophospholipase L1-like esterase